MADTPLTVRQVEKQLQDFSPTKYVHFLDDAGRLHAVLAMAGHADGPAPRDNVLVLTGRQVR